MLAISGQQTAISKKRNSFHEDSTTEIFGMLPKSHSILHLLPIIVLIVLLFSAKGIAQGSKDKANTPSAPRSTLAISGKPSATINVAEDESGMAAEILVNGGRGDNNWKPEDMLGQDPGPEYDEEMFMRDLGDKHWKRYLARGASILPPYYSKSHPLWELATLFTGRSDEDALLKRLLVRQGSLSASQADYLEELGHREAVVSGAAGHIRCDNCGERISRGLDRVAEIAPRAFSEFTRPQRVRIYRIIQKIHMAGAIANSFSSVSSSVYGDDYDQYLSTDPRVKRAIQSYLDTVGLNHTPAEKQTIEEDFRDTIMVLRNGGATPEEIASNADIARFYTAEERDRFIDRARKAQAAEARLKPFEF